MKKIMKKSPLKFEGKGSKTANTQTTEKQSINKTKEGVVYKVNTTTTKSQAAGSKLSVPTTPAKPAQTKTTYTPPKHTAAGDKAYAKLTPAQKKAADAKYRARNTKTTVVSPAEPEKPAPDTSNQEQDTSASDSMKNESGQRDAIGNTALDIRGALRAGKVAARVAGQTERKAARQTRRADRLEARGKGDRAEALRTKAEMNLGVSENAKQYAAKLKEQAQQGSTGNRSFKTSKEVTLAEQDMDAKGITLGSSSASSEASSKSSEVNKPTTTTQSSKPASIDDVKASAKAADADMQKRYAKSDGASSRGAEAIDYEGLKKSSALNMMKSSALKMFKPGSFKMAGFGNKNKK